MASKGKQVTKYVLAARNDILEIFKYIESHGSESIAQGLMAAIVNTCDFLANYPDLGRRRTEYDDFGFEVRSITERGYLILYIYFDAEVHIIRVIHGARDINATMLYPLRDLKNERRN